MRDTSNTGGQGANGMLGLSVEAEAQQKEYYVGPNHKQFHLVAITQLALGLQRISLGRVVHQVGF